MGEPVEEIPANLAVASVIMAGISVTFSLAALGVFLWLYIAQLGIEKFFVQVDKDVCIKAQKSFGGRHISTLLLAELKKKFGSIRESCQSQDTIPKVKLNSKDDHSPDKSGTEKFSSKSSKRDLNKKSSRDTAGTTTGTGVTPESQGITAKSAEEKEGNQIYASLDIEDRLPSYLQSQS